MQKLSSSSGLMLKTYRHPLLSFLLLSPSSSSLVEGGRKELRRQNTDTHWFLTLLRKWSNSVIRYNHQNQLGADNDH